MINYNLKKLEKIILDYQKRKLEFPDSHLIFCLTKKNLKDVIVVSAMAIDEFDIIHPHQRRNGRKTLNAFANNLLLFKNKIKEAKNFDEIYDFVFSGKIRGIGSLAVYDTAFRIGLYLKKTPNKVYLHCGARAGALNLQLPISGKKTLLQSDFPLPFRSPSIKPFEIEDILCNYKNDFKYCIT